MARASIPVDLFNPGQVFACLGFVEAAAEILGDAKGAFDWSEAKSARFQLDAIGEEHPVQAVLGCLATAKVSSISPPGTELCTEKWSVPTRKLGSDESFPFMVPDSPATLPARLDCKWQGRPVRIVIDHWGDTTDRDNVKFWAGSGGYPGAGLVRDALELVRADLPDCADDPFALSKPQSSSFRFDWRRDYVPLDAGFSPNLHGQVTMTGFPVVELLAAIGLSHARPKRTERNKLEYRYSLPGITDPKTLYDPILLRAALGGADLGLPHRDFVMQLGWPGQENQARCITNVIEETRG
ncbi:type I-U CRISPR-associated protein Cas8c [uncultured Thiohalocapsa sp.]|uniref:type I-G CRISPR-associated protein Cas8g2 n=1 Tax=uncultured Thiohalocapsa sp. TaxID=768990 RepID=UPI0025F43AF8|nr:type I-U CRISPR-associated protein Cas8c [uncultured Thiohalocapsa sp.]